MDKSVNWIACERFTRRVGTRITNQGGLTHHMNMPEELCKMLFGIDVMCKGKDIQLIIMQNVKTGKNIITICGQDDYKDLINAMNKE